MTASMTTAVYMPPIRVLTTEQVTAVREASLVILETTGMRIEHDVVLNLLDSAGAMVKDRIVRFPRELVEEAVRKAPRIFRLAGGAETSDIVLEHGGKTFCRPVGGPIYVLDYGSTRRRPATLADVRNWVRVADSLPNLHIVNSIFPYDASSVSGDVSVLRLMLENTSKPLMLSGFGGENTRWIAEMLATFTNNPVPRIMLLSSVNSPLTYGFTQVDTLLSAGQLGIPVNVNSSAMSGATGPITLAGSLVIMNAEIIGGVAIAQILNPGAPVVHAGHPLVFDMKTGHSAVGYTEAGLLAAGIVQVGSSYGLPTGSNGVTCDAPVLDEQAAAEKFVTSYLALLAGANISAGAGSLAALSTGSLEQLVLDNDLYGRMLRTIEGIDFSGDRLAVESIKEVGPYNHYLASDHTLAHLRDEYHPILAANRISAQQWEDESGQDVAGLAHEQVQAILSDEPKTLVDEVTKQKLAIVEKKAIEALARS